MCFPMSHITIKKWYSHVKTSIIAAITYYGEISLRMSKIIFAKWGGGGIREKHKS